jgi:hypothetical protein
MFEQAQNSGAASKLADERGEPPLERCISY